MEKTVTATASSSAQWSRILNDAIPAISVVRKMAGTKPSPRTVRPKKTGAVRMKAMPRHAKVPIPSPATAFIALNRTSTPKPVRTPDRTSGK